MSKKERAKSELVSWVMDHIDQWEMHRDQQFKARWEEYYRTWKGIWSAKDQSRESEISKLIVPATQQAIDISVAEREEAVLGRGRFFDLVDDIQDQDKQDMDFLKQQLWEDMQRDGIPSSISESILYGGIYGTCIGKIVVSEIETKELTQVLVDPTFGISEPRAVGSSRVSVTLVPVDPRQFVIDPAATSIEDALGCAHVLPVPKHSIIKKQQDGVYESGDLGSYTDTGEDSPLGRTSTAGYSDIVKVVEYHGLVPKNLLDGTQDGRELSEFEKFIGEDLDESIELVESIVLIANDRFLLKAVENPYLFRDRSFVAAQHDSVPGQFYGRGEAEKAYHSQKALDAEWRARLDAMALTVHPIMGADISGFRQIPDFKLKPGQVLFTNGPPGQVLQRIDLGSINPNAFAQTGELERQVQQATGSVDSASDLPATAGRTASGLSMVASTSLKRTKRGIAILERNFLGKFVQKALWRYIQFDGNRYPAIDAKFVVNSGMGIVARELEQQQLISLLATVPTDSPAYWLLIRSIYENSSLSNREQMISVVEGFLEQALNPPQPQPDPLAQMQLAKAQFDMQAKQKSLDIELLRAQAEAARVMIEAQKADSDEAKKQSAAIYDLARAQKETTLANVQLFSQMVDNLRETSKEEADEDAGTAAERVRRFS